MKYILITLLFFHSLFIHARDFSQEEVIVNYAYIAYYGRPADPGGLTYWADRLKAEGGNLNNMIQAFGQSQEFTERFGSLSNEELVTNIYIQTLGREPDPAGLNWYVSELESGNRSLQTIAIDVLNGAQGDDAETVRVRAAFSTYYVIAVESGEIEPRNVDLLSDIVKNIEGTQESLEWAAHSLELNGLAAVWNEFNWNEAVWQ